MAASRAIRFCDGDALSRAYMSFLNQHERALILIRLLNFNAAVGNARVFISISAMMVRGGYAAPVHFRGLS